MNFRGREVDLTGGPAGAAGAVVTSCCCLVAGGGPGALLVTVPAAALGLYDDLAGETHARGLRGHLRALREGRVTTGLVKMAGLAAAGTLAAAGSQHSRRRPVVEVLLDGALMAGSANLVNLLDLRPGRALKAVGVLALPATVRTGRSGTAALAAAGTLATAAVLLPGDLREERMLGDCGANALGALLGWSLSAGSRPARIAALAGVVALTLMSERVSFSTAIDAAPVLRRLDQWGRLPA